MRLLRRALVAGCAGAACVYLVLGPPPARSLGRPPAAASAEVDAAVSAWIAEAEAAEEARRLGAWRRGRDRPGVRPAADRPAVEPTAAEPPAVGADGLVDLNRATADEIAELVPDIGYVLADRLVAARPATGWRDWGEIQKVRGIGRVRLASLREHARL